MFEVKDEEEEVVFVEDEEDDEDGVDVSALPSASLSSSFLAANAMAHRNPCFAWGDIVDNSREAGATLLRFDIKKVSCTLLTLVDNGEGMSELKMKEGVLGLAYTKKEATETGQHYGMGSTAAMPRIANFGLFLSKRDGHPRTAGLLSPTLSSVLGARELKCPQCSWDDADRLLETTSADAPLTLAAREASLRVMLSRTPFKTQKDLLDLFQLLEERSSGTVLVLWDLQPEFEIRYRERDVVLRAERQPNGGTGPTAQEPRWEHDKSLRSFLSVLYYTDDNIKEKMAIELFGKVVQPRNWSTDLWSAVSYKHRKAKRGVSQPFTLRLGYRKPFSEVYASFRDGTAGKDKTLQEHCGIFYYHKFRLILPLVRTKQQNSNTTQQRTTKLRLTQLGLGLVGCCREGHLTPAHNKNEYFHPRLSAGMATAASSDAVRPGTFEDLEAAVKTKMDEHLRDHVSVELKKLVDAEAAAAATKAPEDDEDDEAEEGDDQGDDKGEEGGGQAVAPSETDQKLWKGAAAAGWRMKVHGNHHYQYLAPDGRRFTSRRAASEAAEAMPQQGKSRGASKAASKASRKRPADAAVAAIDEADGETQVRAPDGSVGILRECATAGYFQVECLSSGRLSKKKFRRFELVSLSEEQQQQDEGTELCEACGRGDDAEGNEMLLCDGEGCGKGFHLQCLAEPLASVPPGDWFCSACNQAGSDAAVEEAPDVAAIEVEVEVEDPQEEAAATADAGGVMDLVYYGDVASSPAEQPNVVAPSMDEIFKSGGAEEQLQAIDAQPQWEDSGTGDTLLHLAAYFGSAEHVLLHIMRRRPDAPEKPNHDRELPLHLAAKQAHLHTVRLLLLAALGDRSGAAETSDKFGDTPLHIAARTASNRDPDLRRRAEQVALHLLQHQPASKAVAFAERKNKKRQSALDLAPVALCESMRRVLNGEGDLL